jgi:Ala-tRNA(Pro) deacylase
MTLSKRIRRFLQEELADYRLLRHQDESAAQRIAAALDVPGRQMAKPILVRDVGGECALAVLPATERLDLAALALATGHESLELADEGQLKEVFSDCELGSIPPFGNLYGVRTFVDGCLRGVPEIFFQGGDHHEIIGMRWPEYERLARPVVGQLCFHRPHRKTA